MANVIGDNNLKVIVKKGLEALGGLSIVKNKVSVILHILGLKREKYVKYVLKNGLVFIAPNLKKDRTIILSINEIIRQNVYSVESSNEKKAIFDLGANVGVFSIFSARLNPNSIVYAFEPDIKTFEQLQANIRVNDLEGRVIPLNLAVSNVNGQVSFFIDELTTRGSSMFRNIGAEKKVDSISLGKAVKDLQIEKCDIVKMDIEGAEYEVLYNCPDSILKSIDRLFVEVHPEFGRLSNRYNSEEMKKFLSRSGFEIVKEHDLIISATRTGKSQQGSISRLA